MFEEQIFAVQEQAEELEIRLEDAIDAGDAEQAAELRQELSELAEELEELKSYQEQDTGTYSGWDAYRAVGMNQRDFI